jgi:hypothetical protein
VRKISFVATRPKKFKIGAWLIMKVLGTDYSHVCILFHSTSNLNKFYPYEANGHTGVNFVGQDPWSARNMIVWQMTKDIQDESYNEVLDYAMSMCGEVYATMQNVGIKICDWFGIKYNAFSKGKNCSELVKKIAAKIGYILTEDDNRITPRQAVDKLRELEANNG